jgi:hypothetical protein
MTITPSGYRLMTQSLPGNTAFAETFAGESSASDWRNATPWREFG